MENLFKNLTEKKKQLGKHKPLPKALIDNLNDWLKIELTYTSNAIEGNTLSRAETALVVEKGITVRGRTLVEHLEAINHAEALEFTRKLVGKKSFTEKDLLRIHWLILKKIDDSNAGRYRTVQVRIAGLNMALPSSTKVPELMEDLFKWLHRKSKDHPVKIASDAHLKLVSIHPFVDGNGRTARLLLNMLLMKKGYPPALIRKEDRQAYISSIAKAQQEEIYDDYYKVICKAVNRSLNIYLEALNPKSDRNKKLLKGKQLLRIGELAREINETVHTVRYWTKNGLLEVKELTEGGYQLFDQSMIKRAKKIRQLQKKERLSIDEIKARIKKLYG